MFTGIIEETGKIDAVILGSNSARLKIEAKKVLEELQPGDSVNTNGVCLTVTTFNQTSFEVDVMAETMRSTNLGILRAGHEVNLERALRLSDRLGGHILSGHIDGTGIITGLRKEDIAIWLDIEAPENITRYIIQKGSVAVDGVSLTVSGVDKNSFSVSIIPFTGSKTALLDKKKGNTVNIECDMVAKYIRKFIFEESKEKQKVIDYQFLKEHGFTD